MTTVFGNPGSTEETFLKCFPSDFTYVLPTLLKPVRGPERKAIVSSGDDAQ
jgi:hypothetical protein